jgi:hypothetical protein
MNKEQSMGEKLTRFSKVVDAGSIAVGVLVAPINPVLATNLIGYSLVTFYAANKIEKRLKKD